MDVDKKQIVKDIVLDRFMEYDKVDGGVDILGKPVDCPLQSESEDKE